VHYVNAHFERARKAGAAILEEPKDTFYGHRRYGAEDPEGHQWYFAQGIAKRLKPKKKRCEEPLRRRSFYAMKYRQAEINVQPFRSSLANGRLLRLRWRPSTGIQLPQRRRNRSVVKGQVCKLQLSKRRQKVSAHLFKSISMPGKATMKTKFSPTIRIMS
jgi:hypothetical protein